MATLKEASQKKIKDTCEELSNMLIGFDQTEKNEKTDVQAESEKPKSTCKETLQRLKKQLEELS